MMSSNEKPIRLTNQLILVKQYAEEMGRTVHVGIATTPDNKTFPIIVISHGNHPIIVREENSMTVVFSEIRVSEDIKKKYRQCDPAIQERILLAVKHSLLSKCNFGYRMFPPSLKSISELDKIQIEQVFRLSRSDPSCINRFADAMQGVVSATLEVLLIIGSIDPGNSAPDNKPPEPGMYR